VKISVEQEEKNVRLLDSDESNIIINKNKLTNLFGLVVKIFCLILAILFPVYIYTIDSFYTRQNVLTVCLWVLTIGFFNGLIHLKKSAESPLFPDNKMKITLIEVSINMLILLIFTACVFFIIPRYVSGLGEDSLFLTAGFMYVAIRSVCMAAVVSIFVSIYFYVKYNYIICLMTINMLFAILASSSVYILYMGNLENFEYFIPSLVIAVPYALMLLVSLLTIFYYKKRSKL